MKDKKTGEKSCRLGSVGGQAVLEGIMMRAGNRIALSVRKTDGTIANDVEEMSNPSEKYKILKAPIIRGVANFIAMMKLSVKTLNKSADMIGLEEEEPGKVEKWLDKHFGKSVTAIATTIGSVLGILLSIFLFMYIPTLLSQLLFGTEQLEGGMRLLKSVFSGALKIFIFLLYVALVGLIPDIKRTFQYHGAEHKSIFCHEKELPLTVENIKKQSRFHPRCGTSFMVVMMIIGIFISFFLVNIPSTLIQTALKILTLPLVVGLGYEFIRYAGKCDNILIRILSAPGLWIQYLTTKEPDEKQIEVAINALKIALPDIYPEAEELLNPKKDVDDTTEEPAENETL